MSPHFHGSWLAALLSAAVICSAAADDFSNRFTDFDWMLTKFCVQNVGSRARYENVVISPVSVKLVLATLHEGARANTSRQLAQALNLSQDPQQNRITVATFAAIVRSLQVPGEGYDLDVATKVYVDDGTVPYDMFKSKIRFLYDAAVESVDFDKGQETVDMINKWVNSVTRGHIQHLISDGDSLRDAAMIILNAIFFKGKWEYPFDAKKTQTGNFWVSPSRTVQVSYMREVNTFMHAEAPSIKASVVRLPYSGDKFAMYIILPEKKNGLEDVVRSITPEKLREVKASMENSEVNLQLPKFNFEFTASLIETLKELGLTDMFTSSANFSGIAPQTNADLYVSNVLQKAGLEVNEIGSIAFAATQVELSNKFGEEFVEFTVDRPFMFFIEDEPTMTVVFAGKVVDPTLKGSPTVRVIQPAQDKQQTTKPQHRPSTSTTNESETEGDSQNRYGPTKRPPGAGRFSFFDIELLQWVYSVRTSKNFVLSPASVKTCLGVVLEGARGNTAAEIGRLLRLQGNDSQAAKNRLHDYVDLLTGTGDSGGVKLRMGNRVLVKSGLGTSSSFKQDIDNFYSAKVNSVDFSNAQSVSQEVNSWVSDITDGFIPGLLSPDALDINSQVMVVNAFYFKGDWKYPFEESDTQKSCFYIGESSSRCVKTPMMSLTGSFKHGRIDSLNSHVLELPYANERYSMVIVLPERGNSMRQVLKDLPFAALASYLEQVEEQEVAVTIPRFSMEYSVQMIPLLKQGGVKDLFGDKCDLGGMFTEMQSKKPYISSIFHKAKIVVNEKGTTAGAATVVAAVPLMFQEAVNFIADHEFLFMIRDEQTGFMFVGLFAEPEEAGDEHQERPQPTRPRPRPSRPTRPQMGAEESETSTIPAQSPPPRGGQITSRPYPPRRRPTPKSDKERDALYFS